MYITFTICSTHTLYMYITFTLCTTIILYIYNVNRRRHNLHHFAVFSTFRFLETGFMHDVPAALIEHCRLSYLPKHTHVACI